MKRKCPACNQRIEVVQFENKNQFVFHLSKSRGLCANSGGKVK